MVFGITNKLCKIGSLHLVKTKKHSSVYFRNSSPVLNFEGRKGFFSKSYQALILNILIGRGFFNWATFISTIVISLRIRGVSRITAFYIEPLRDKFITKTFLRFRSKPFANKPHRHNHRNNDS